MPYNSKPYKIEEIKQLTPEVKLFKIKSNINPQPGQFIEVSIPGIGECPLASSVYNKSYIDIVVRKAGNLTSALFQLKKDDSVFIRGAYGKGFPLKELMNKNLILIAGGTGIAPLSSLINYIEQNRKNFKEIYIYSCFRDEACILLKDKISKWKKQFNLIVSLDKASGKIEHKKGLITDILDRHKPNTKDTLAVICGPEIMMEKATEKLNQLGLTNDKIYWSMERRMECGIGNCGRCLIQDVYVCKDGPVFKYDFIKPRIDNENSNEKQNSPALKCKD